MSRSGCFSFWFSQVGYRERVCAASECDEMVCGGGNGCGDAGRRRRFWRDGSGAGGGASGNPGSGCRSGHPAPQAPPRRRRPPRCATPAAPPAHIRRAPVVTAAPQGGTIKGTVKASGVPLPGVAVTATNSVTGKKYATTTEIDGAFQMAVPSNGRYVVKTDLTGFASVTQEMVVNAASQNGGLPCRRRSSRWTSPRGSRRCQRRRPPRPPAGPATATGAGRATPAAGGTTRRGCQGGSWHAGVDGAEQ